MKHAARWMAAVGMTVMGVQAVAEIEQSAPQTPEAAASAVRTETPLSALFVERYPELAKLNGFGGIPFSDVTDTLGERVSKSRKVTLVVYPAHARTAIANSYLIYNVPCEDDAARNCHYLGVMTQFGMPIQRMYGPLDLELRPGIELRLQALRDSLAL
ncbi:hypothetical protein [Mitsuaria sp. GD03876]|uniref:hypothetical protein n=1 Tax=Mitsuaria sp. GD03876 TaxID=2975399 RepID=UPI002447AD92|nr:hypothetical protein [Mitsuaria sp. GD03876]MDH0864175.1 hypothetical protein [Mitsuaria sp. GD03876]